MSIRTFYSCKLELTCDGCDEQAASSKGSIYQQETYPQMPEGWTSLVFGTRGPIALCPTCGRDAALTIGGRREIPLQRTAEEDLAEAREDLLSAEGRLSP